MTPDFTQRAHNCPQDSLPKSVNQSHNRQELVECLCELFVEIDINGDGFLQWEEFTGFIIDNGMIERDTTLADRVKPYYRVPSRPLCGSRSRPPDSSIGSTSLDIKLSLIEK